MRLSLSSKDDEYLSYRISKHPDSIFERKIRNGSAVVGKWDGNAFCVTVEHNYELILIHAKQTNKANYNDSVYWLSGPYNLVGFLEVFKSAMQGRMTLTGELLNGLVIDDEAYEYELIISPVEYNVFVLSELFQDTGISFSFLESYETVVTVEFTAKMKLTEFLQKIYILLYAFHYKQTMTKADNDKLFSLKRYFSDWIDELPQKDKIINRLADYKVGSIEKLTNELPEKREGLHVVRHRKVAEILKVFSFNSLLDLGCGEGKILDYNDFTEKTITLVDTDDFRLRKIKKNVVQTNLLFPLLPKYQPVDVVTMVEVIEHFDSEERKRLYELLENYYQPKTIVLTTPNFDYNVNYGLTGYRHSDHKIEFTIGVLRNELQENLPNYSFEISGFDESVEDSPSFFVVLRRLIPQTEPKDEIIEQLFNDSNVREINRGLCSNAFVKNWRNLFYLGYSISPSESDGVKLESVAQAIEYYNRYEEVILFEKKYMGSRGYILFFRTEELAKEYGFNQTLIVNSRNGFKFFYDDKVMNDLYNELLDTPYEMLMLDCEILPWSYKAKKMIYQDFLLPLEAEKLHYANRITAFGYAQEAINDLNNALGCLINVTFDPEIRFIIFDIIVKDGVLLQWPKSAVNNTISILCEGKNLLQPVQWGYTLDSISNGVFDEGILIKPDTMSLTTLPALKVRNPHFLRLIYGAHYQDYIKMFSERPTKKKRSQSRYEYACSREIAESVVNKNLVQRIKYLGLFLSEQFRSYDNTL